MNGKSGLRWAAAGLWKGAAILRLWGTMTETGGWHVSAATMGMGVDQKQFETHLWTCRQNTSILVYMPLLDTNRLAP